MREGGGGGEAEGAEKRERFSVVTDILSDVEEVDLRQEEEEEEKGGRRRRHPRRKQPGIHPPLPPLGQLRRYRNILPRIHGTSPIGRGHLAPAGEERLTKAPPQPPLCVIRFCVSHSKTCDKDSRASAEECQAAMSSTATLVSSAARARPEENANGGGGAGAAVGGIPVAAVRNRMSGDGGGGGDIVTVTTVPKAIRPWDVATNAVSSNGKRWVRFCLAYEFMTCPSYVNPVFVRFACWMVIISALRTVHRV